MTNVGICTTDDADKVIDNIINAYGGEVASLSRTKEFLEAALRSEEICCLICLEGIQKTDAIWSCDCCFESLHMSCVQKWGRDSISYQKDAAIDRFGPSADIDAKSFKWSCPKCRTEYSYSLIPERYYCFCKKAVNPCYDPWLVPHSCSEICRKELKPKCGHRCLLPCHPGPCPPCPKTVNAICHCEKSSPKTLRCSSKTWSCGKPCGKTLNCGQHPCQQPCHEGPCSPCEKRSVQRCQCRKKTMERPCYTPNWQCEMPCGKAYSCGSHDCEIVCHEGPCGLCPLSLTRSCPCGKSSYLLPCTKSIPNCGSTCGKQLSCGSHYCAERCHRGPCGTCLQMSVKECRCGNKRKELPCYKEFTCESKCKRLRDCRRHPCNRKCCNKDCPPCEQVCGRVLGCGNHKCAGRCHEGRCYPCHEKVVLTCACGASRITVPCGREKNVKPPKCGKQCQVPSDCHHPERRRHLCHFGKCPPCKRECGLNYPDCDHICVTPCHDNVLVKVDSDTGKKRSGPWEKLKEPSIEIRKLPCPPCDVPVPVTCLGGHETKNWPCHNSKPSSCYRPCGQVLLCSNHICSRPCHKVEDGRNLKEMSCGHRCFNTCHSGSCTSSKDCKKKKKITCLCKRIKREVMCCQDQSVNEKLKCDEQCIEKMSAKEKEKHNCETDDKIKRNRLEQEEYEKFQKKFNPKKKSRQQRSDETPETNDSKLISKFLFPISLVGIFVGITFYFVFNEKGFWD
ncbi:NF-X1-type zinc finger protein NFXL1-like isoform X2 [Artemia franciscana]|uniref:NF-X1-type zinc finger protein NFXL1-like isoform X2 n=1 Tax=Artemia franciscana TaxID=6661 RepID=UPI0032D9C24F